MRVCVSFSRHEFQEDVVELLVALYLADSGLCGNNPFPSEDAFVFQSG